MYVCVGGGQTKSKEWMTSLIYSYLYNFLLVYSLIIGLAPGPVCSYSKGWLLMLPGEAKHHVGLIDPGNSVS